MRRVEGGIATFGTVHRCIVCSGCLCCLVSLKSRPNPGLLVLDILTGNGSLAPMQISPLFLFKKEYPGLTKLRISTKRALACFVPSQFGPAANVILARRLLGSVRLVLKPAETSSKSKNVARRCTPP